MKMASVAVLMDAKTVQKRQQFGLNVFELYIEEILTHAGMPYVVMDSIEGLERCNPNILIASVSAEDQHTKDKLWQYAHSGGTSISYGGLAGLADQLGIIAQKSTETGYASMPQYTFLTAPLRYLRAVIWQSESYMSQSGQLHEGSPNGVELGALQQQWQVGKGEIHRFAVDIPTTIVHLQQGIEPVLTDGLPAPDGTAAINEGILKADDGMQLDWLIDREITDTSMPYFAYPYADYWRQLLISHLIQCALAKGLTLPFVAQWPEGTEQVALISFDSDFNRDDTALTTLDVLGSLKVPSTWCMIEPGYSSYVYTRVTEDGHELALHYNALEQEDGEWGAEAFKRQLEWALSATDMPAIVSNKNHYTRYEGWGELFRWCEDNGIEVDQTRGPTKRGNVGFLFGTCQPYFPISWFDEKNRLYDVLEIGFVTQDMNHPALSDTSIIEPLLDRIAGVSGVAHFLFHQIHIHEQEPVRNAIGELVNKAKQRGYSFWTSQQINEWQRARRNIRITANNNEFVVEGLQEDYPAIVWIPTIAHSEATTYQYGIPCIAKSFEHSNL